jgi:hypothetical protein
MTEYNELLSQLAAQRFTLAVAKEMKTAMVKAFEETPSQQAIQSTIEAANSQITELEKDLRLKALADFSVNGIKKPHPALGIRVTSKVVYDPKEAETWAKENLPTAFTFDTKFFEVYVKNVSDVPCATIEQVPTATIATDLSAYLKEAK